ncbi:lysozyme [Flaviaesturariibacter amylovorans]|uniref:Lysozyme n=1 Tax=Flaviaesturariibacter amylovorans TaxID=1084520 RepID=A0ABP8GL42_9BACT
MDFKRFLRQLALFEGIRLNAYQDQVGIWTIGIGTIRYPDGTPVMKGDKITLAQAYQYAEVEARHMLAALTKMLKVPQTEEQLIALLSLQYNIGTAGLASSTVMRSINAKKDIATIERAWLMWNKGTIDGKKVEIPGLATRRKSEIKIYKGLLKP